MGEKKNDPPNREPDPHGSDFEPTAPRSLIQGVAYASTRPAGLRSVPVPAAPSPSPRIERITADQVMSLVRRNNRVCPLPPQWQRLYELIGAPTQGQAPPPPLTGPAWHSTSSLAKRMCLRDHLEFAEAVGRLAEAREFLQFLPEEQWYHMGE